MSQSPTSLENRAVDYIVAALKGGAGAVPLVGSVVAEALGTLIPNQRLDRVADFVRKLAEQLSEAEAAALRSRLSDPEAVGLLEECFIQASRSYTEARRSHLASFVKEGLTGASFDHHETARLLNLLTQLSDLELLMLQAYCRDYEEAAQMDPAVRRLLVGPSVTLGSGNEVLDEDALAGSRKLHLDSLGLLKPRYPFLRQGEVPKFDPSTGSFQNSGYETTRIGRILLVYVGLRQEVGF